jgi:hypothetical protein
MEKNRVFTKEELEEMSGRTIDAAIAALEAGNIEKAKKLMKRMHREFQSLHDIYVNWAADMMDYIYRRDGEEALYEATRKSTETSIDTVIDLYTKADFRRQVEMLAAGLRAHLQKIHIEEDDEKVCIEMDPCGSGQRLLESGAYGPPRNLSRLKPHRLTWGLPNFPVYCAHGPVEEIMCIERIGYPVYVVFPAKEIAKKSCRYCIFKDPKAIPEEVYKRVGMEKPK